MTIISKHTSPKAMPKTMFSRDVVFSEDDVLDGDEKFVGGGI